MSSRRVVEHSPVVLGNISPLELEINTGTEYLDITGSYFSVEPQLKKSDGTAKANGDTIQSGQNLIHSMIKQCTVHVNGVLVSPQNDTSAYKTYLETLMNYDNEDAETHLRLQGWLPRCLDLPATVVANTFDTTNVAFTALSANKQTAVRALIAAKQDYVGANSK